MKPLLSTPSGSSVSGGPSESSSSTSASASFLLGRHTHGSSNPNDHSVTSSNDGLQYQVIRSGSSSLHHHHELLDNGTFRIEETTTNDSGEYSCLAFNGIGLGITRIVHLTVSRESISYITHTTMSWQQHDIILSLLKLQLFRTFRTSFWINANMSLPLCIIARKSV